MIYGIDIGELRPESTVARLEYPVLVIHGIADQRVPLEHGERVVEAAKEGSSLWQVPDTDHGDAFLTYPDEYVDRVTEYLRSRFE